MSACANHGCASLHLPRVGEPALLPKEDGGMGGGAIRDLQLISRELDAVKRAGPWRPVCMERREEGEDGVPSHTSVFGRQLASSTLGRGLGLGQRSEEGDQAFPRVMAPRPLTCSDKAFLWEGLPTRPCSLRFLNFRKYSWIKKVA